MIGNVHGSLHYIRLAKFLLNNYRRISVLPIISKINERHVHDMFFYEYLKRCNLINEKPSGFRPKHSCKAVFDSIIEKWLRNNIDNGKFMERLGCLIA